MKTPVTLRPAVLARAQAPSTSTSTGAVCARAAPLISAPTRAAVGNSFFMAIFLYSVECQRGRECAGPTKYWRVIRLRQQLSKIQLIRGRPGARAAAVARQCAQGYAWQRGRAGPVPRGGAGAGRPAARAPGRPPGRTEGNRAGGRTAAGRRHGCASAVR